MTDVRASVVSGPGPQLAERGRRGSVKLLGVRRNQLNDRPRSTATPIRGICRRQRAFTTRRGTGPALATPPAGAGLFVRADSPTFSVGLVSRPAIGAGCDVARQTC